MPTEIKYHEVIFKDNRKKTRVWEKVGFIQELPDGRMKFFMYPNVALSFLVESANGNGWCSVVPRGDDNMDDLGPKDAKGLDMGGEVRPVVLWLAMAFAAGYYLGSIVASMIHAGVWAPIGG